MTKSHSYLLIEARLGQPLEERVTEAREQGLSWTRIAFDIYKDTDVLVTTVTLRNWFATKTNAA